MYLKFMCVLKAYDVLFVKLFLHISFELDLQEIQVEFEALPPQADDFHGIKRLLQQVNHLSGFKYNTFSQKFKASYEMQVVLEKMTYS